MFDEAGLKAALEQVEGWEGEMNLSTAFLAVKKHLWSWTLTLPWPTLPLHWRRHHQAVAGDVGSGLVQR